MTASGKTRAEVCTLPEKENKMLFKHETSQFLQLKFSFNGDEVVLCVIVPFRSSAAVALCNLYPKRRGMGWMVERENSHRKVTEVKIHDLVPFSVFKSNYYNMTTVRVFWFLKLVEKNDSNFLSL